MRKETFQFRIKQRQTIMIRKKFEEDQNKRVNASCKECFVRQLPTHCFTIDGLQKNHSSAVRTEDRCGRYESHDQMNLHYTRTVHTHRRIGATSQCGPCVPFCWRSGHTHILPGGLAKKRPPLCQGRAVLAIHATMVNTKRCAIIVFPLFLSFFSSPNHHFHINSNNDSSEGALSIIKNTWPTTTQIPPAREH